MEKTINKILNLLIDSGDYLSGEYIGNILGISRIAVNKQIKKLISNGVDIEVSRKGYKYNDSDNLIPQSIAKSLKQNGIDIPVLVEEVVSTNSEVKKLYPDMNREFLFVAPRQISGRGRLDRVFVSGYGGVYMTLCYKPTKMFVADSLKAVLLTGLAVAKVLKKYTDDVAIKWPNDVFVCGKKICGILLESVVTENMTEAIFLGIGVNITNEIPIELKDKVTSLKLENIPTFPREQYICEIITLIYEMLELYQNEGFGPFIKEYCDLSMSINHEVTVNCNGIIKNGFGVGLSEEGYLLLDCDGKVEKIILGDIEV